MDMDTPPSTLPGQQSCSRSTARSLSITGQRAARPRDPELHRSKSCLSLLSWVGFSWEAHAELPLTSTAHRATRKREGKKFFVCTTKDMLRFALLRALRAHRSGKQELVSSLLTATPWGGKWCLRVSRQRPQDSPRGGTLTSRLSSVPLSTIRSRRDGCVLRWCFSPAGALTPGVMLFSLSCPSFQPLKDRLCFSGRVTPFPVGKICFLLHLCAFEELGADVCGGSGPAPSSAACRELGGSWGTFLRRRETVHPHSKQQVH